MIKNILRIIAFFVIGAVAGIFSTQILWPYFIERPLFYKYKLDQFPIQVVEVKEITIQENDALQEALAKAERSVVGIRTTVKSGTLEGSGLIVTSDGLVITLADLLPAGSNAVLYIDGKQAAFQVLKKDAANNLALIKIQQNNFPAASFGDFYKIRQGERVFLAGVVFENNNPKKIANEGMIRYFDENLIQTNIFDKKAVQGSPLFDIESNVIGLNLVDKEGRISAIPVSKLREFAGL